MNKELLKKLLMIMCGFTVLLIVFIVVMMIVHNSSSKKISYEKIKSNAIEAARNYYDNLEIKLEAGESKEIFISDLISEGYMEDFSEKLESDVKCDGKVNITNSLGDIRYFAVLNCGSSYMEETLYEHIINNNEIVQSGEGIYDMYGRYIYRGEFVNNYVNFDGKTWYIVDIEKDGTIRLVSSKKVLSSNVVWDDRYNTSTNNSVGYNDFEKSRIYETLKDLATGNSVLSGNAKNKVLGQQICYGLRSEMENDNSNLVDCSRTIGDQMFSTLTVSDVITASIDNTCNSIRQSQCGNYNYLSSRKVSGFWTTIADSKDNHTVYSVSNGTIFYKDTNSYYNLFVTIKLPSQSLYLSGDGTINNPYKIEEN